MFRVLTITIAGRSETIDKHVHVTSLKNNTSLYFELISPIRIYYSNRDFVTYIHLTIYDIKFESLRNYFQFTSDIAHTSKTRKKRL